MEIRLFGEYHTLSLFYNKIYKTENTESSVILNKIRSLLGGSSEHGFREHRPCYIHGRTHVGISDVAKCGKGILVHKPNKIILFTVTLLLPKCQPVFKKSSYFCCYVSLPD